MDKPANRFYGEQRVVVKEGLYGAVNLYGFDGKYARIDCKQYMTSEELRESANFFNQLAEYMESKD